MRIIPENNIYFDATPNAIHHLGNYDIKLGSVGIGGPRPRIEWELVGIDSDAEAASNRVINTYTKFKQLPFFDRSKEFRIGLKPLLFETFVAPLPIHIVL